MLGDSGWENPAGRIRLGESGWENPAGRKWNKMLTLLDLYLPPLA